MQSIECMVRILHRASQSAPAIVHSCCSAKTGSWEQKGDVVKRNTSDEEAKEKTLARRPPTAVDTGLRFAFTSCG